MLAAAAVALVERLLLAGALALALARRGARRRGRLAGARTRAARSPPRSCGTGRRSTGSSATSSAAGSTRGASSPATRSCTRRTRSTTGSRSSRTTSSRYLRFDSSFQSGMYKDDPYRTRFDYSDYLQLPLAYRPATRRMLYIGLGGGSAPKRTWRDFPATRIDVVELDPEVVDVAYEYFDVPRDPRLRVEVEDGRRFLADARRALGRDRDRRLLLRLDPVPPGHARVPRAGALAARARRHRLDQHHRRRPRPDSRLFRSMLRTYRAVFPTVAIHPVRGEGDRPRRASGTSSSSPATARRRRRSSSSSAGHELRKQVAGRARPDRRDPGPRRRRRRDRGRAGADGRLRADRRAAAALRLAGERLGDRVPLGRDRLQLLRRLLERDVDDLVPVQRRHPAEAARSTSSAALSP